MDDDNDLRVANISRRVSPKVYFFTTLSLFLVILLGGIFINDLTLIFGFIAAFSESLFNFILPGYLYIASCRLTYKKPNPFLYVSSLVFILFGLSLFFGANYNNIVKLQNAFNS